MGRVPELPAGQPKWVLHSSISIALLPNEKYGLNLSADRSVSQLIILLGPEVVISCSWKHFPEYFLAMLKRRNELKEYNSFDWGCTIEDDSCLVIFNCCCFGWRDLMKILRKILLHFCFSTVIFFPRYCWNAYCPWHHWRWKRVFWTKSVRPWHHHSPRSLSSI